METDVLVFVIGNLAETRREWSNFLFLVSRCIRTAETRLKLKVSCFRNVFELQKRLISRCYPHFFFSGIHFRRKKNLQTGLHNL